MCNLRHIIGCVFSLVSILLSCLLIRGTDAAASLPFRPGESAVCGSCPLVTPRQLVLNTCILFDTTIVYAYVYYVVCVV